MSYPGSVPTNNKATTGEQSAAIYRSAFAREASRVERPASKQARLTDVAAYRDRELAVSAEVHYNDIE